MEFRLRRRPRDRGRTAPDGARKPLYVTEFGVRGIQNIPGKPAIQPGYWQDGTPLSRTNIAAFQHLWFDIAPAQLGYSGAVKWDAYWGRYTPGYRETYNLIGPAEEGWPLFPAYHALKLLFQTTERGWQVVRVDPWEEDDWKQGEVDEPEKELAAFVGSNELLTVLGLDSNGRGLNARRRRASAELQHRRTSGEHDVHARPLERAAGTARARSRAPSGPTRPASPASRCRCTQRFH